MSSLKISGIFLSVVSLGVLGLAVGASGQSYETFAHQRESIVSRSRFRLGPAYMIPGFQLALTHDDNILGVSEEYSRVEDSAARLGISLDAHWLTTPWLTLSANLAPSYDYYFDVTSERSLNREMALAGRLLLLGRFPVSGGYSFSRNRYRFSAEIEQRAFVEAKGYYAGFNIETPRNSSLGITFSETDLSYEDLAFADASATLAQALDRSEKEVRLDLFYPVFIDSQFYASTSWTDYAFAHEAGGFRDSRSFESYLGLRFPFLGRARGNIALGYKRFRPRDASLPRFSGIVGNTNAEFRFGRFNLRLLYSRDVPFSYGTSVFFLNSALGGGLSLYPAHFLRLDYDYRSGRSEYPEAEEAVPPAVEVPRIDNYRSHSVGAVFRIVRRLGLGVRADIFERRSNAYGDINRTLFGAYLTYDF